jgi:hypothetical protein
MGDKGGKKDKGNCEKCKKTRNLLIDFSKKYL